VIQKSQISGVFWFLISLVVILESLRMGLGSPRTPGSGFLPFIWGIALALLSGVTMIKASLRAKVDVDKKPLAVNWSFLKRFGFVVVGLLAFTFIFPHLGFFFSLFWLLVFLLHDTQKKWILPLFEAAIAVVVSYLLFAVFLQIQFPSSPWWR
jgi:hypothetical protein